MIDLLSTCHRIFFPSVMVPLTRFRVARTNRQTTIQRAHFVDDGPDYLKAFHFALT